MKNGWQEKSVGEILQLEYGKPLDEGDRESDGRFPVYGANGEKDRTDRFYHDKPSIIVGRKGSAGEINLTENKFWPLDVTYFVTFDERQYDLRFLYYLLTTLDLPKLAKGVKPGINRNEVYSQVTNVPPLPEQKRIVAILDAAFAGIEAAAANAEKNLRYLDELFQSIIAEAIAGRITADWRRVHSNTESASGPIEQRLTQRRIKLKGRGSYTEPKPPATDNSVTIPDSWTWTSPEYISIYIVDCPHSTPKWGKKGVVCLRTTNFKPGFLDLESVQFVSEETYKERIKRLEPKPNDVLYSREGGILGIACVFPSGLRACLGQRMMQFRLDSSRALPKYFAAVLNSKLILSEVKRLTGGAASPHLNIRDIRTFSIPLPPIAEQYKIVEKLDSLSTETRRLESIYQRKLAALIELKQSILQKAFTGELTAQPAGQEVLA